MRNQWTDDRWEALMRKAIQYRVAPAGEPRRDVQWQRIRKHLDAYPRRPGWVYLGPWSFSRVGLASYCLLLLILVTPLAFSEQLTGIGHRLFAPVALQENVASPEKADLIVDGRKKQAAFDRPAPEGKGGAETSGMGGALPAGTPEPEAGLKMMAVPEPSMESEPGENQEPSPDSVRTADEARAVRHGLTVDEVKAAAPYPVRFPRNLPAEFNLVDITYEAHSMETGKVILFFEHPEGKYLRLEQETVTGRTWEEPLIQNGSPEFLTIKGYTGKIFIRGEDWCDLRWIEGDIAFRMWGQISPAQMKEIAEAL